jgi:hypothetical protein
MEVQGPDAGDTFLAWLQNLELVAPALRNQECSELAWCSDAPMLNQAGCGKVQEQCHGRETQSGVTQSTPAQQLLAKANDAVSPPCEARASLAAAGYDSEATQDDSDMLASQPRFAAAGNSTPRSVSLQSADARQVCSIAVHALQAELYTTFSL